MVGEQIEFLISKCAVCGIALSNPPEWQGLYCYVYCCGHCPHRTKSPCQKEQFEAKKAGLKPEETKKGIDLAMQLYDLQHKGEE